MLCRLIRPAGLVAGSPQGPAQNADANLDHEPIAWRAAGAGWGGVASPQAGKALSAGESPALGLSDADLQARLQVAYRQGEAAGARAATERLTVPLASLGQMTRELAALAPRVRAEAELAVVQLAVAIARRVLHREISTNPTALLGVVKSACERLNARELSRLRAAPPDASLLQEHRAAIGLPPGLEIVADPGLAPGCAIFETVRGEMDASVETQLDEIERGLADRMRRRG
jgi:flagellar assembly protein FliH